MEQKELKILIDFDSTVCRLESIPFVAEWLEHPLCAEIEALTSEAGSLSGDSYEENLHRRVAMMSDVTAADFEAALDESYMNLGILNFIKDNPDICEIASCNLDCWIAPMVSKWGVRGHFSRATVSDGIVKSVDSVLDKAALVSSFKEDGFTVVYIGDGIPDERAFEAADISFTLDNETPQSWIDNEDAMLQSYLAKL